MADEEKSVRAGGSNESLLSNRPFVIGLLFAATVVLGFTNIVGVVLAYVFRGREHEAWEASHFRYLIATFWLAFVPLVIAYVSFISLFLLTNNAIWGLLVFPVIIAAFVHSMVRTIMSMMKSNIRQPMPNPNSWTI